MPKARPRIGTNFVYTPKKTKEFEALVGWSVVQEKQRLHVNGLLDPPIEASMTFYLHGNKTGDIDNYIKSILDGMNSFAYHDDREVKRLFNVEIINCPKDAQRSLVTVRSYKQI